MNLVKIDTDKCKECLYCINFCPAKVMEIGEKLNSHGYYTAEFKNAEKCVACGICATVCPEAAVSVYKDEN